MSLTYAKCLELLKGKSRKKLAGNTYLVASGFTADGISVVFHNTSILTFYPDGRVRVNSGGHRTVTTKARINEYMPGIGVYQRSHLWFWTGHIPFVDGVLINPEETKCRTEEPEEFKLVRAHLMGECPAGIVTDWRKEKGLIPV